MYILLYVVYEYLTIEYAVIVQFVGVQYPHIITIYIINIKSKKLMNIHVFSESGNRWI